LITLLLKAYELPTRELEWERAGKDLEKSVDQLCRSPAVKRQEALVLKLW
jgi:hypothetical protein